MVETTKNQTLPHKDLELSPVLSELDGQNRRTFIKLFAGALLFGSLPTVRACESAKTAPAGSLIIGGGGELSQEIRDHFVKLAGGDKARIVIIPTASANADFPDQSVDMYWGEEDKVASALLLHTRSRIEANLPSFVQPLNEATGVWFSGGDQSRIADAYVGTLAEERCNTVLRRGGVVGGTSAGGAVMSPIMIAGGNPIPTLGKGFRFLEQFVRRTCIIDQHFDTRNRIQRLLHALKLHPESVGLGVGWGAALLVNGSDITVMGKNVWLCNADGKSKEYSPGEKVDVDL
ncbi:cyanophycinase [Candidatus Peregrinibacteria bacterium]|nr:cyanophycinase [Candidatus Peregrinibacteria bacterium]